MDRAERIRQRLGAFSGPGAAPAAKLAIYLDFLLPHPEQVGDYLARGAYTVPERGEIWAVCRPESPAEGLEEGIARLLYFEPHAPEAGQVPFLRAGLTAYVMAYAGHPPPVQRVHAGTLERMRMGAPIVCQPAFVERSNVQAREDTDLALSLFAFLATHYSVPALQNFLQLYSVQNPDRAAVGAFQKPLAT